MKRGKLRVSGIHLPYGTAVLAYAQIGPGHGAPGARCQRPIMQTQAQQPAPKDCSLAGRHFMLLQGPLGPFFADLAQHLMAAGATVERVCFNRGDWHYAHGTSVTRFEGRAENWQAWLSSRLAENPTDSVIAYGDSRFYHRIARDVCASANVPFWGLEEGYVRPGFVTCEEGGNNANSRFPRWFSEAYPDIENCAAPEPADVGNTFMHQLWFAVQYYLMKDWRIGGFRGYEHHRRGNWLTEVSAWMRGGVRKYLTVGPNERGLTDILEQEAKSHSIFFVPLQVAVDAQMVHHSRFASVPAFIEEVITSFAAFAPENARLVIKHHPMDRGFHHYGSVIKKLARRAGVEHRVIYAFDLNIEQLFGFVSGCITVNSTVGIQALEEGVPTLMLGIASANIAGLTSRQSLDDFWSAFGEVDKTRVQAFRSALVQKTQIAGSFYRNRDLAATAIVSKLAERLS